MDDRNRNSSKGDLFSGMRRRRTSSASRALPAILALLVLVAVGAGVWYWVQTRGTDADDLATAPTTAEPAEETPAGEEVDLDLPPLDASDEFVRDLGVRLSSHPQLAAWLATDELVQRFVTSVVNVAAGATPSPQAPFLVPEEEFGVQEEGERLVVDPASYNRYNLFAETFVSIDAEEAARLYRGMRPLFEEAYAELGIEDRSFDQTLAVAIGNLVAVEVPDDPPAVVPGEGIVYEFEDPAIERLSNAQKHMYRLGPTNARRVQAKLLEVSEELGIEPTPAR